MHKGVRYIDGDNEEDTDSDSILSPSPVFGAPKQARKTRCPARLPEEPDSDSDLFPPTPQLKRRRTTNGNTKKKSQSNRLREIPQNNDKLRHEAQTSGEHTVRKDRKTMKAALLADSDSDSEWLSSLTGLGAPSRRTSQGQPSSTDNELRKIQSRIMQSPEKSPGGGHVIAGKHKSPNAYRSSKHKSPNAPSCSKHRPPNSPGSSKPRSPNSPCRSKHESPNAPSSSKHKSPNAPSCSKHRPPNSPGSSKPRSPNSPCRSKHESPNAPSSSKHKSPNAPSRSRHKSPNAPSTSTPRLPSLTPREMSLQKLVEIRKQRNKRQREMQCEEGGNLNEAAASVHENCPAETLESQYEALFGEPYSDQSDSEYLPKQQKRSFSSTQTPSSSGAAAQRRKMPRREGTSSKKKARGHHTASSTQQNSSDIQVITLSDSDSEDSLWSTIDVSDGELERIINGGSGNQESNAQGSGRASFAIGGAHAGRTCPAAARGSARGHTVEAGARATEFVAASALVSGSPTCSPSRPCRRSCPCKHSTPDGRLPNNRKPLRRPERTSANRWQQLDVETAEGSTSEAETSMSHAVRVANQMEKDEEMARRLQEDLDRQYAAALASGASYTPDSQQTGQLLSSTGGSDDDAAVDAALFSRLPVEWQANTRRPRRPRGYEELLPVQLPVADVPTRRQTRSRTNPRRRTRVTARGARNHLNIDDLEEEMLMVQDQVNAILGLGIMPGIGTGLNHSLADGGNYEELLALEDQLGAVMPRVGLSPEQISRLPVTTYKAATAPSDASRCHVCMSDYVDGERLRLLTCFHSFHCDCIDQWIKDNPTCPVCRIEVQV